MKVSLKTITLITAFAMIGCVKISDKKTDSGASATVAPKPSADEIQEPITFSGLMDLKESSDPDHQIVYRAKKIIVEDGTVLRTNGASILIEAEELEATNWQIETFSQADSQHQEATFADGKNSGKVEVHVTKSATGSWQIFPRGQAGSTGERGMNASEVPGFVPAANGAEGSPSVAYILDNSSLFPIPIPICHQEAGRGGRGEDGKDGIVGGDGYNGGDSGEVIVYLPSSSTVRIEIQRIAGAGGLGGVGGQGSSGGAGGVGGKESIMYGKTVCAKGPDGENGNAGKNGSNGQPGKPGNQTIACVQRGEARVCTDKIN